MSRRTAVEALAEATGSVNGQRDVHDTLAQLMNDCHDLLPAAGAGVLVASRPGVLDLLAATSHHTAQLELFQLQRETGPCPECIATGTAVTVIGAAQIRARWGTVGDAIVGAGFDAVHAFPIRWNDTTLGALNVFGSSPESDHPDTTLGQAFADLIGMLLVRRLDLDSDQISSRLRDVLQGRSVIEQAKGLLAYQRSIPADVAYEQLQQLAAERRQTLSTVAAGLIHDAQIR